MTRYKHNDYGQKKMRPVSYERRKLPGTFEHTLAFTIVAAVFVMASCAVAPAVSVSGNTTASPRLHKDTLALLSAAFQAKSNCSRIEAVETEIVSVPPEVRGNESNAVTQGIIKERWTAVGCGQRMPLEVTFTPDGKGGAYIGFALEK